MIVFTICETVDSKENLKRREGKVKYSYDRGNKQAALLAYLIGEAGIITVSTGWQPDHVAFMCVI